MNAIAFMKEHEVSRALPNAETNVANCFHQLVLLVSLPVLAAVERLAAVLYLNGHLITWGLDLEVLWEESFEVEEISEQVELRELD